MLIRSICAGAVIVAVLGFYSGDGLAQHSQMRMPVAVAADRGGNNINLNNYLKNQSVIMSEMMNNMSDVKKSGNASIDFLQGMLPHHQAAVAMSEDYLENGAGNKRLKILAEKIIKTQKEEIKEMEALRARIRASGEKDGVQEAAYWKEYDQMMKLHHQEGSQSKVFDNVDEAFAKGMSGHHQMAVDMAKAILNNTNDKAVRVLALNIISGQEQEIALMKTILKKLQK